jgi:serine dehydrogenase proteinase
MIMEAAEHEYGKGGAMIPENGPMSGGLEADIGPMGGGSGFYREIAPTQREQIQAAGKQFRKETNGENCLIVAGRIIGRGDQGESTERRIQRCCENLFGFPNPSRPSEPINVILDSTGGPLDSAFKAVLVLSRYTQSIHVYVPRRAKSASTLIALGANEIVMSPFGELGPLDTQVRDPRNPTDYVSALDLYQSVDYVRDFGFSTLTDVLKNLAFVTQGRISLANSVKIGSKYALGSITPMLEQVNAIDFGGWGRSLKIGERYAQILLARVDPLDKARSERIAKRLVYGYTHHLFPIDITEAKEMGLNAQEMSEGQYEAASEIVSTCRDDEVCVEFIGDPNEPGADGETG